MNDLSERRLLLRVQELEAKLAKEVERRSLVENRLGDLEETFGAHIAHVTAEWRKIDRSLEDMRDTFDRRADFHERAFDLENQRHKLLSAEIARLGQAISQMSEDFREETTGIKELRALNQKGDSMYPERPKSKPDIEVSDSEPPDTKKDKYAKAKLMGSIAAALAGAAAFVKALMDAFGSFK